MICGPIRTAHSSDQCRETGLSSCAASPIQLPIMEVEIMFSLHSGRNSLLRRALSYAGLPCGALGEQTDGRRSPLPGAGGIGHAEMHLLLIPPPRFAVATRYNAVVLCHGCGGRRSNLLRLQSRGRQRTMGPPRSLPTRRPRGRGGKRGSEDTTLWATRRAAN
jgi:hypothetical protein